jgi:hypothetical protein
MQSAKICKLIIYTEYVVIFCNLINQRIRFRMAELLTQSIVLSRRSTQTKIRRNGTHSICVTEFSFQSFNEIVINFCDRVYLDFPLIDFVQVVLLVDSRL